MADLDESDQVFIPSVSLLPHHEDQPFMKQMHHDAHRERHRNTRDYVTNSHSPETNRRNAGVLLRRMSDDFDARKFPEVIEGVKMRKRARSLDFTESPDQSEPNNDKAPSKVIKFLRRLSSGAITPSDPKPRSLMVSQQPPLTESTEEDMDDNQTDISQDGQ